MVTVTGFAYWWRRLAGWFPVQACMLCGRWYWGGLPTWEGWQACMQEYCSHKCHDDAEGF